MYDDEFFPTQEHLLTVYRSNLSHLLQQAAHFGGEIYAPLYIVNNIRQQRSNIQRIKVVLRASGAIVEDHTDDEFRWEQTENSRVVTPRTEFHFGSMPPLPALFIGREDDLHNLKARLRITTNVRPTTHMQVLTAVHGWPGVGKTAVAAVLAHDSDIAATFPDGVLWTSLGQTPSLLSELAAWGRALGVDDLGACTIEEASARLTALLHNKRMLLIVDDVWDPEHIIPFRVGGNGSAMLMTTRINSVAFTLAPTPEAIYKLPVLTDEKALELLQILAPTAVSQHRNQAHVLVHELEGLPLALQVAGHLLNVENSYGLGVTDLLTELREGARLLEAQAPADRADIANETTPTVAALLQKSTDRLDPSIRDCFAYLGAFAPKPATFDLTAMGSVWQVDNPNSIVRVLVDRGLLEPIAGRFQMHALLVMHAKSLLAKD